MIHLGYGIEFQIPAVIAEGLAQFATTDLYIGDALLDIEKAAKEADPGRVYFPPVIDEVFFPADLAPLHRKMTKLLLNWPRRYMTI